MDMDKQSEGEKQSGDCPQKNIIDLYLDSLSPRERQAYEIARDHLGSAFSLEKSVGYVRWLSSSSSSKIGSSST